MTKRSRPVVLAITSDQHCGSTVALCPPRIQLDDGGSYEASKAQRWLWENWGAFWHRARDLCTEHGADLYAVFNGDLTEGDHHGTTQILSGNPTAQAAVVNACMAVPLAAAPSKMWFIRGTEAHVGSSACFEERIAQGLTKDRRPVVQCEETGTASHWEASLEIHGTRIHCAHHGRVGTRPWTRFNVTANLAAEIFYEYSADAAAEGAASTHPHFAFRSHMHQYVDTGSAHPTRVIQTPAWQLKTAFTHRIDTSGKLAHIGGVFLVLKPGSAELIPMHFKPTRPPAWRP